MAQVQLDYFVCIKDTEMMKARGHARIEATTTVVRPDPSQAEAISAPSRSALILVSLPEGEIP